MPGKRMPDSILRPGSRVTFGVFPADNIPQASQYQEGSKIDPLSSKDFSCGISIDLDGEMRFYKVGIVIEPPPSKQ